MIATASSGQPPADMRGSSLVKFVVVVVLNMPTAILPYVKAKPKPADQLTFGT